MAKHVQNHRSRSTLSSAVGDQTGPHIVILVVGGWGWNGLASHPRLRTCCFDQKAPTNDWLTGTVV